MNGHADSGSSNASSEPESTVAARLPYVKPAFRHEKVFETMALACGKINNTQSGCHSNRKNS